MKYCTLNFPVQCKMNSDDWHFFRKLLRKITICLQFSEYVLKNWKETVANFKLQELQKITKLMVSYKMYAKQKKTTKINSFHILWYFITLLCKVEFASAKCDLHMNFARICFKPLLTILLYDFSIFNCVVIEESTSNSVKSGRSL